MAYDVIKTIKRRKYLYRQESYRVGDSVKTRSTYIGAVDPVTGELKERKLKVAKPKSHHLINPLRFISFRISCSSRPICPSTEVFSCVLLIR